MASNSAASSAAGGRDGFVGSAAREDVVVGVNKFRLDHEDAMDVREIDNTAVRESQLKRLAQVKATRERFDRAMTAGRRCIEHAKRHGLLVRAIGDTITLGPSLDSRHGPGVIVF